MTLSRKEKIGYGIGDTASNLVWATLMSFGMYYYTDVCGLGAAAVGAMFLFARAFDGVVDFLVGAAADRTETRWGKFRPYLLWMCAPMGLATVLTFSGPSLGDAGKLVYAWVTYNLLMIVYSAINIPYSALSGVMTDDPLERTSLNSYRMVLAQFGGLFVNAATLPLVAAFGRGDQALGFRWTAALFGVLAVGLFLVTFLATRERIRPPAGQRSSLAHDLGCLLRNRPWLVMFAAGMLDLTFIVVRSGCLVYHCKYCLGFGEARTGAFLLLGNLGFIAGAAATRRAVGWAGKKRAVIGAHLLMAASAAGVVWVGPATWWCAFVLQALHSCGGGLNAAVYWSMIADTADYSEWRFGNRATGIVFSATTCSQKIGMGLGGALAGWLLARFGYVANAVQSEQAGQGITWLVSLLPAAGLLAAGCLFAGYRLTEPVCRAMRTELGARREATARGGGSG